MGTSRIPWSRVTNLLKAFSFLTLLLSLSPLAPVNATSKVEVLSHSGFRDLIGLYHVVGEVQNTGNIDVAVSATASFYDSNNSFISNSTSQTLISVLLAGRRAPFDIVLCPSSDIITCQQESERVDHYRLSASLSPYPGLFSLGLEILSNTSLSVDPFDPLGRGHIMGVIGNSASDKASSVKVVATFHNSSGTVIAVALSDTNPEPIGPGGQASFDIALDGDKVPSVAGFTLTATSSRHGLLSKFPFNSVLSLNAPSTTVGVQTTLTSVLRDENRQPIPNAGIEFSLYQDGRWKMIGSSTSNNEGLATTTYRPTLPGRFPVNATYSGSTNHSGSGDMVTLVVEERATSPRSDVVVFLLQYIFVFPVATAAFALSYLFLKRQPKRA